ncbi:hypothetical protein [Nonomuraea typhae]|uniref:hypothetical protein n=1 Tax=Nonomuraea typhae TaxID=2603600 RepID=UPI0012FCEA80|nr:hypothetical protein [Nonomuraea typhae]
MNGLTAWVRAELRQRRHHRAFRIGPPGWDGGRRATLQSMLAGLDTADDALSHLGEKALADAVTNLWSARRKLSQPRADGRRPTQEAKQAGRYLRNSGEAFAEAGLVVQDHDGDAFHPGRSLEVLVFEDDPALTTETVLETVRPSIYLHDRRIQMGQVIVGRPAHPPATERQ